MKRTALLLLVVGLAAPLIGQPAVARVVDLRGLWRGLAEAAPSKKLYYANALRLTPGLSQAGLTN